MTAQTATKKVLVVDDDPVVSKSFDRVLTPKGYAVIAAAGGEEALEKLENEHYDVVFTDIKMPGMDGIEVARRIKASRPWLPVVIVTGYGSDENEAQARDAGVTGFLRKPLSPEMIEASAASSAFPEAVLVEPSAEATVIAAPKKPRNVVKDIALFIGAPFIGLAYIIALPFVGLGMLAYIGYQAFTGRGQRPERD
jgi:CheY-like chemotaxis protein